MRWLLLIPLVALLELQNLLAYFRSAIRLDPWLRPSDDYTVIVPIYGHPRYLQNLGYLETIKPNVLIALNIDSPVMAEFADALEADGWRVHRGRCRTKPVGVPELCLSALRSGLVTTTFAVRLDGDSAAREDLGLAIAAIARADADLCSVKVAAANTGGVLQRLQEVEYAMAMRSRHYRPWLTSGACMVGKTAVLRHILSQHSRWFPGEDMETGHIAKHFSYRVAHCDFTMYTAVPDTWRAWFRQRRCWWSGNFRHTVQNFDLNIRYSFWMLYYLVLVWILLTGKVLALPRDYEYIPLLIVVYTAVTLVANWPVRSRWMIAFPYYALFHVIVMPLVGALYYVTLCFQRGRTGRYRIGLRRRKPDPSLQPASGSSAARHSATTALYRALRSPEEAVVRLRTADELYRAGEVDAAHAELQRGLALCRRPPRARLSEA